MSVEELNYWGISPALDLQEDFEKVFHYLNKEDSFLKNDEINILILASADGRHMLKTISSMQQHPKKFINICFVEESYVAICRQLLFLRLLCQESKRKSLLGTAEVFLEIFGNTFVRHSTNEIIKEEASVLRGLVDSNWGTYFPFVCADGLKQSELSKIADTFRKLYDTIDFDIQQQWENRLRRDLGTRYDCRKNVYDWDFHVKMEGCAIIGLQKYMDWRETGVAFKCRESRYRYPNVTMCHDQDNRQKDVYLGDTQSSPYLAFGIETDHKALLQTVNGIHEKTSEDVSLYNIISLLKGIEKLQPLQDRIKVQLLVSDKKCIAEKLTDLKRSFDCIYLSHNLDIDIGLIANLLKEGGLIFTETLKYAVMYKKEYKSEYGLRLKSRAKESNLTQLELHNFQENTHIVFTKSALQLDFHSKETAAEPN